MDFINDDLHFANQELSSSLPPELWNLDLNKDVDALNQTAISVVTGDASMDLTREFDTQKGVNFPTNDGNFDLNLETDSIYISPIQKEHGENQDLAESTNWNSMLYCLPTGGLDSFPTSIQRVLKDSYLQDVRWTDCMHSSYLNLIEAAFVKELSARKSSFFKENMHPDLTVNGTLLSNECQNNLKRKLSFSNATDNGKKMSVEGQLQHSAFVSNSPAENVGYKKTILAICKHCEGKEVWRPDAKVHSKYKHLRERTNCTNIQLHHFPKSDQVLRSTYGERDYHCCDLSKCNTNTNFTSTGKDETVFSLTCAAINVKDPKSSVVFLKNGNKDVEGKFLNYDREGRSHKGIQFAGKSPISLHQNMPRHTGDQHMQQLISRKWVPHSISLASQDLRRWHMKHGNQS